MLIDTLRYVKILEGRGVERRLAEAHAEAIDEASRDDLATKADINDLRLATSADINDLRLTTKAAMDELRLSTKSELNELRQSTKSDLNELLQSTKSDLNELRLATRADISELRAEMYRAMMLQAGVIVGATVALIKLLP